ncbi:MAG: glycine--tRNA ligase [Halobacteriaceae archaeon]
MTDLAELAKRRGFFFQSASAYGGVGGFYSYGPAGAALKQNVEDAWRDRFAVREGNIEIDAPTIMPEPVFEASGHLDIFDDMLVECGECGGTHRADHLVEDNSDIEDAETYDPAEMVEVIADLDLQCPTCGAALAGRPVEEFNLMFETGIGPGDGQPGYLRPETAQGIFVEFPRLKEYARGQLPFGVTQIGRAYRNEISPRNALVRTREFTQAELELFLRPDYEDPDLSSVADVSLTLYPAERQGEGDTEYLETTVADAVADGVVENAWVAYYLGVAARWYDRIGIDMDRFRFRQHQAGERAHYANDCWDAEADVGDDEAEWIEMAGFADRGQYDLSKHGEYSDDDFTVFEEYDEPRTVERATVDPDMSYLGPEFGGEAAAIAERLESLARSDPEAFEGDVVTVTVDDETHEIPVEKTGFAVTEETESGEHVTPRVVEPSFGVDRAVFAVLTHNDGTDEVEGEERRVLRLPPEIAPTTVAVFPLMDRDGMGDRADEVAQRLREAGLSVTYDDSGNIGRRYRRQDEVGTPFCVTVDYDTLEDDTVTLRERDSTEQARVPIADLADELAALAEGRRDFAALVE